MVYVLSNSVNFLRKMSYRNYGVTVNSGDKMDPNVKNNQYVDAKMFNNSVAKMSNAKNAKFVFK